MRKFALLLNRLVLSDVRVTSDCCLCFGTLKLATTARLNCIYGMTLCIVPHLFGTGNTVARQIVIYENATYFFSLYSGRRRRVAVGIVIVTSLSG